MGRSAVLAALVVLAASAAAQEAPPAREGFRALVRACKAEKTEELETLLPAVAGRPVTSNEREKTVAWRKEFAAELAKATVKEARGSGDRSVVRFRLEGEQEDREILMTLSGTTWVAACPVGYVVRGRSLDGINGRRPAKTTLAARTTNAQYVDSAVSFAHVTKDPRQCLNRMDLWYCHNGDLHGVAETRIARVAAADLSSLEGIPAGAAWKKTLTPEKDGVYAVHCRRDGHRDFFVKLRVTGIDAQGISFEWALLGAGPGAPDSIHEARPLVSKDAADGFDGLCAKMRKRPEPEPVPKEETGTPR